MKSLVLLLFFWIFSNHSLPAQAPRTEVLNLNILIPAAETFDPGIQKVLLAIGPGIASSRFIALTDRDTVREINPDLRQTARQCIASLYNHLTQAPGIKPSVDSTIGIEVPGYNLEWEWISATCTASGTEALLLLDGLKIDVSVSETVTRDIVLRQANSSDFIEEQIENYTRYYQSRSILDWKLFIPSSQTIRGWRTPLDDCFWIDVAGYSSLPGLLSKKNTDRALLRISKAAAAQLTLQLAPTWVPVQRVFFTSGSAAMRTAARLMSKGKTKEAATIWKQIMLGPNKQLIPYARFNLALVSEIRGQAEEAYQDILDIYRKTRMPEAGDYAIILKQCASDEKKIRAQIRISEQSSLSHSPL